VFTDSSAVGYRSAPVHHMLSVSDCVFTVVTKILSSTESEMFLDHKISILE